MTDAEWRAQMAEHRRTRRESLEQIQARKAARQQERQEMESLGLIRQQAFSMPISSFGKGIIDQLELEAKTTRNLYLEENGTEAVKQKFPLTWPEFWPGI
ncbi:MAG: hypothetical protein EHM79_05490 [Geobacter sp.]|nr:MAG: hypothetical protein EHM79_05490 [Geobacter sp.]